MFCAASEYACVGLTEQLPVLPDGRHPRVDGEQHVVRVGDRLTDDVALAAHRLRPPPTAPSSASPGRWTWTTDCRFWNTVLTSTVTLRECSTAPGLSGCGLASVRHDEIDVLGAECGAGLDLRLDDCSAGTGTVPGRSSGSASRDRHLRHRSAAPMDVDFADLDTAQLHLRAVLHDQPGPVGHQRERDVARAAFRRTAGRSAC